ncbi:hypothetical protein FF098_000835 [Parvularcula flava]|uniref:Membrane protein YkvI n=1 Tax=Aquisalinus luteolus TaxID=1566827 RepID=A0A8J3A166_9PROT|nr:hypothetical protein [Aquisalinus luteolus]NHK26447.1 hypothetical protein [Aquisalinus luteolus]GGH92361.1 hypothetical protein GCM10011355_01680 [Aquisalinus luteolus]
MNTGASPFRRFVLPGLAFKAVVIGGGYATGRELIEFFFDAGPRGGLYALAFVALLWSVICTMTFLLAYAWRTYDYKSFFQKMLGPFWRVFELAYILFLLLILAVFGAAAGEIGASFAPVPVWVGTAVFAAMILGITALGNESVEGLFRYAALFLYAVYVVFAVLVYMKFGGEVGDALSSAGTTGPWLGDAWTYAGYNVVGAVVVLPVVRHFTKSRDAVVAGMLSGPLAAIPAMIFLAAMTAFYPAIADEALPAEYILAQLGQPLFYFAFQLMILLALLETSVGCVNALNERIAKAMESKGRVMTPRLRTGITVILIAFAMVVATRFGLIALIASGYRFLGYTFIAVFILPLFTVGAWQLYRLRSREGGSTDGAGETA